MSSGCQKYLNMDSKLQMKDKLTVFGYQNVRNGWEERVCFSCKNDIQTENLDKFIFIQKRDCTDQLDFFYKPKVLKVFYNKDKYYDTVKWFKSDY